MQCCQWRAGVPALAVLGVWVLASGATEPIELLRQPYLQQATPSSITIVWRTQGEIDPLVQFGEQLGDWDDEVGIEGCALAVHLDLAGPDEPALHSAPDNCFQYEVTLEGLEPDTRYFYQVLDGERVLAGGDESYFFRTSPKPGEARDFRLWVVGDSGNGSAAQRAVFEARREFVEQDGRPIDAYLHVGDMAYNDGTDEEFQRHFFDVYEPLLRHTVCWPTFGNHEGHTADGKEAVGPYFDAYVVPAQGEAGGVPSGTESYYSFDLGQIHFVSLNSYDVDRRPKGSMAQWLEKDLAESQSDWLIAFFHHPPYTKGTHDSDWENRHVEMRTHLMPILEKHGVDLVLGGHSHIYERSMLLDGAYATPTVAEGVILDDGDGRVDGDGAYRKSRGRIPHQGTVAIVTGHGGAGVGRFGTMPVMRSIHAEHGSVLIDFEGERLRATMLNARGEVRDQFELSKQGTVSPVRVAHPWQPLGPEANVEREFSSGEHHWVLTPRPNAPDAVIHYTLDGSQPGVSSPRYQEPVLMTEDVELRAISFWKDGDRTSPVAEHSLRHWPKGKWYSQIDRPEDDVEEDDRINQGSSDLTLAGAGDQIVAVRFRDLPMTRQDTVEFAAVQFTAEENDNAESHLQIHGAIGAGETLLEDRRSPRQLAVTEAVVDWEVPEWKKRDARRAQRTPDLSPIFNELLSRDDWVPGSAVTLLIRGKGRRTAYSWDGRSERAARLMIECAVGEASTR